MKNKLLLLLMGTCVLTLTNCSQGSEQISSDSVSNEESDSVSSEISTEENSSSSDVQVEEDSFNLLGEDYSSIQKLNTLNGKASNWNDNFAKGDFNGESTIIYEQAYKDNVLQEGKVTINEQDDVKYVFYNNNSARFVSNADGYAFTIPTTTTLVGDFSVGKYRSKLYNEDFTLSISYEHSNPYNNWETYREEWLYRYLDNENYYELNDLTTTQYPITNDLSVLSGYIVDRYDVMINNPMRIDKYYYNIASIRKVGEIKDFMFLVMKSTTNQNEMFDKIIQSYTPLSKQGTANNNFLNNLPTKFNENWNEETKAYYELLLSQQRTGWGLFTATLPDGTITKSQLKQTDAYLTQQEMSEALDYQFDILPTYQHIAWNRNTLPKWPTSAAREMAGGNGFNGKPVIQMSYQFTDNNNDVGVSNKTDCYTPMFDIYRGAYEDSDTYYDTPQNKYENALRALARSIKAYKKPVLFRLNNEMNTDWTSYSGIMSLNDPDIFQATWRILYNIFEEEGVDNCIWIFNPIAKSCPFSSWGEDMSYYPGLDYVQALGLTYYENNNNNDVNYYTFRKDYTALYEKNNPVWKNYPWIISEFGCGAGGDASGIRYRNQASQVEYVKGMFADFNDRENHPYLQNIKGAVWFSVNDYSSDGGVINQLQLEVDKLPLTIQAMKEGLSHNKI